MIQGMMAIGIGKHVKHVSMSFGQFQAHSSNNIYQFSTSDQLYV